MAQWIGGFSGLTHATKLADLEKSLRQAVKALAEASAADRARKVWAVRRLGQRVLDGRLKLLRARLSKAKELKYKDGKASQSLVPNLDLRLEEIQAEGIDDILKEFGACERIQPR
jgi:hypothetical protein